MEKRVDIKLEEETLKWAGIEAAKLGISRRKYIGKSLTVFRLLLQSGAINLDSFEMFKEVNKKDGYTVERPFRGILYKGNLIKKGFNITKEE